MAWEATTIGGQSCRQDSNMGCAFACIATVINWLTGVQHTESAIRQRLTLDSILWSEKKNAMTGGLNLATASALLQGLAVQAKAFEGLSKDAFQEKLRNASPDAPLLVGVVWTTGDQHLVVCAGPSSPGKVWIFDPAVGLGEHPVEPLYKQAGNLGLFDLKVVQVFGTF